MALAKFRIRDFRCLDRVELSADPDLNLVVGNNAAGKTSLLEAIYYLGRGRSFRGATNQELIRNNSDTFTLFAEVSTIDAADTPVIQKLGCEVSRGTKVLRLDGAGAKSSDLVAALPVQAIDPEIHELIQGGPEKRRRFLDWGVFHVEHSYMDAWRAYKATLKQRNAALKSNSSNELIKMWDQALIENGSKLDQYRKSFISDFKSQLDAILFDMFPFSLNIDYAPGWKAEFSFEEALLQSFARDRVMHATQVGPHRADLKLRIDERSARHRLSRGQQKLLGAALVIAQTHFVAESVKNRLVLLVDDPAAELDPEHQEHLFRLLQTVPAQLFISSLDPTGISWENAGKTFSIEAGKVRPLL